MTKFLASFFVSLFTLGGPVKNDVPPKIVDLKQGDSLKLGDLTLKLFKLEPLSSDYTKEHKKSSAYFEYEVDGKRETADLGGYYERSPIVAGQMLTLLSYHSGTAKIEIKPVSLYLNASEFKSKMKKVELAVSKPIEINGLTMNVAQFYFDGEQGLPIIKLDFKKKDIQKSITRTEPYNFLDYFITTRFKEGHCFIELRPLKAGDEFYLYPGEIIKFSDSGIQLEIKEQRDIGNAIQFKFSITKGRQSIVEEIKLNYQAEAEDSSIPEGKRPAPPEKNYKEENSKTKIVFNDYELEKVRRVGVLNEYTANIFKLVRIKK